MTVATLPAGSTFLVLYGMAGAYLAHGRYHDVKDIDSRAATVSTGATLVAFTASLALAVVGGYGADEVVWTPIVGAIVASFGALLVVDRFWLDADYDGETEFEEVTDDGAA